MTQKEVIEFCDIFMIFYGIVDTLIIFNVGIFTEGSISKSREKICKDYLKGKFWIDSIGTMAFLISYMNFH